VNDGPVAVNDTGRATEDGGAVVLDVLGNDTDADEGDTKSLLSLNNTGTIGAISIANGKIAYDPGTYFQSLKAGQTTTDTFSYTMKDEAGAMSTATVTMTITGVNDGPRAVNDEDFVDEDQTLVLDLLSNDTDVDGDALTIVEARAQFGTATIFTVDGKTIVSYTASADSFDKLATGATATDTITYRISDGQGGFSTATVKITVKGINDGIVILGTNQSDSISGVPDRLGRDRDETIEGFNGADILNGMGGADRLIGGNGDDILSGGNGWDELYGDHGNDRLDGGAGLDFLDGGLGDDRLFGGADADIFFFGKANGNDTILDFQGGVDTLQFGTGVSIKNKTMVDTNGDGVADSTLLQLSTGSVTLIGVTSSQWDFFA
jgi:VCBS repeat-containing protein